MGRRGAKSLHVPNKDTRALVEHMIAFGITAPQISNILEVSERTLRRLYKDELVNGLPKSVTAVAANLFKIATGNGPQAAFAAKFYLQTRARWTTVEHIELHGVPRAEDEHIGRLLDIRSMTDDDLLALEGITERLGRRAERTIEIAPSDQVATRRLASGD
jgi:AraC-like DNA-binding protein